MELLIPDLESEYGIKPRSVIKSKYFYIIASGMKLYRLYPFLQTEEDAERLFGLNDAALKVCCVCPTVRTKSGSAVSCFEDKLFILTSVPKGTEPEPSGEAFLKTVSLMGRFHKVLRNFPPTEEPTELPYEKGVQTLKNIKSIINRKNKLSEIDKLFTENYAQMYSLAESAAVTLSDCRLERTYCYGTPKEENFILAKDGCAYLTNWSMLRVSHFLADLAYMIKRYDKKSPDRSFSHEFIIKCYEKENPLSANESKALSSLIGFPEKYISVVKEYYGRHRPFAPLYVKEKLSKEINAAKRLN